MARETMRTFWYGLVGAGVGYVSTFALASVAWAEQPLFIAYPPENHQTTAAQIFLIGTAAPEGDVRVNGEVIEQRSPAGHFAPSVPLELGENIFTLTHQDQELVVRVTRVTDQPPVPVGTNFAEGSLTPAVDLARLPGELICFGAIAPPQATVSVSLGNQTIPLQPQSGTVELPPNYAILTSQNQPIPVEISENYQGCMTAANIGNLGQPQFQLTLNGETIREMGEGRVEILNPATVEIATVTADSGTARTGPSTNYSRLTPLPQGTRAAITGREGDWLRLDYGAWIRASEIEMTTGSVPPRSTIRSFRARQQGDRTEVVFPLQTPVPVSVQQGRNTFTLTLHNTTAQTDTFLLNDDPVIEWLDWQQVAPGQVQYTFHLKSNQQWGYTLNYEGTSLVLALRHPPELRGDRPLQGVSILLDPGHGSSEDLGARGPTGYPEKDVVLIVSQLIQQELLQRGATVYMTREGDDDLYPQDRVNIINEVEPAIALSIHYNALPDDGDAVNTAGIGTFWYHPQAHNLSVFLHNYLVETLDRPSYGVFWNNLALTRPTVAPSVLLELGFMINPYEFEWIMDPEEQRRLAGAIADGLVEWVRASPNSPPN